MKESVLVIDISGQVSTASVVVVEHNNIKGRNYNFYPFTKNKPLTKENLDLENNNGSIDSSNEVTNQKPISEELSSQNHPSQKLSSQKLSINEIHTAKSLPKEYFTVLETDDDSEKKHKVQTEFAEFFNSLLGKIENTYDGSLLILPSLENLNFNLSLPFTDKRNLSKIIDLEIQDTTPFDLDNFLIDYKIANKKSTGESNIFVSCINRNLVKTLLSILKDLKIDPHCVTSPSATLSGLLWAIPDLKQRAFVIIHCSIEELSILLYSKETALGLKTIPLNSSSIMLLTQFLTSQEIYLDEKFDEIILVGEQSIAKSISKTITDWKTNFYDVKKYTNYSQDNSFLQTIYESDKDDLSLTLLGSQLVIESPQVPILSNFRTREFTFLPKIKELAETAKKLLPTTFVMVFVVSFCLISYYLLKDYRVENYNRVLKEQISNLAPSLLAPENKEIDSLQEELKKLDKQLKELGSSSALTPLQSFAMLSKNLPIGSNVTIRKLSITPNRILIEGSAPDYSAVEKVERMLKREKESFCRIKKDTGATAIGQADKRSFNFDILICDNNNKPLS